MIEPEMAFCDLDGNRQLAEEFLKYVIADVLDHCRAGPGVLQQAASTTRSWQTLEHVAASDFEHVTYTEAIRILEKSRTRTWEFPVHWGADLQSEHERYLTEEMFKKPVIVTDYPREIKAFYMRLNEDGKTVARHGRPRPPHRRDHRRQPARRAPRRAARDASAAAGPARRSLLVVSGAAQATAPRPHAGFGLGLERMMMYLTGMKNIRDVIPFPRTPGSRSFERPMRDLTSPIIGAPLDLGQGRRGVDMGPSALRVANLNARLARSATRSKTTATSRSSRPKPARKGHAQPSISRRLPQPASASPIPVEQTSQPAPPLVLGGDHSVAVGTVSGVSHHFRKRDQQSALSGSMPMPT